MISAPIVAATLRAERRIIDHLRGAGATSSASACPPPDLSRRIRKRQLDRLVASGAVVATGPGLYYLDESAYLLHRRRRRARVATLVTLFAAVAMAALALAAWVAWRRSPG